jgi:hypothetical protein
MNKKNNLEKGCTKVGEFKNEITYELRAIYQLLFIHSVCVCVLQDLGVPTSGKMSDRTKKVGFKRS